MQSANQRFFFSIKYLRLGSFLHQKLRKPLYTHLSLVTFVNFDYCNVQSPLRFTKIFTSKASAGFKLCCQSCVSVQQVRSITPLLMELHWLPVEQRINFKILLITYKALNGQAPTYISDLFTYYRPARLLRSSTQNLLRNPCYNLKNYGGRSFAVAAPRLWNALPMAVKSSNSVDIFKRQLKSYLFLCSYVNC